MQSIPQDTDQSQEEWRPILGFGEYECSNLGRIRRRSTRAFMKPHVDHGYLRVTLRADGRSRMVRVHRAMLLAFHPDTYFPGALARHLDDNRTNNILSNLAWGTTQDNANDALRNSRVSQGERHPRHKLSEADVSRMLSMRRSGARIREVATAFSMSYGRTKTILSGRGWLHRLEIQNERREREGKPFPRGEASWSSRLTAEQVKYIRSQPRKYGTNTRLARLFGVAPSTISGIMCGRSWKPTEEVRHG